MAATLAAKASAKDLAECAQTAADKQQTSSSAQCRGRARGRLLSCAAFFTRAFWLFLVIRRLRNVDVCTSDSPYQYKSAHVASVFRSFSDHFAFFFTIVDFMGV